MFDSPNGTITGTLGMENDIYNSGYRTITWRDGEHGGPRMHIPEEALIAIGYEVDGLIVRKAENGFLKIMYKDGELTAWIKESDLKDAGFKYYTWKSFMTDTGQTFFTMSLDIARDKKQRAR